MMTLPDDIASKIIAKLEEDYRIGVFGPWDDPSFDDISTEELVATVQEVINKNLLNAT